MKLTLNFRELGKNDANIAGGKGASLGEMTQAGIPVPPGFVILSTTFDEFIKEADLVQQINVILDKVDSKEMATINKASETIQRLIENAVMPKIIEQEIEKQFKELDTKHVAVRSSATAEDGAENAWAGQLSTYLNTTKNDLLGNVKKCWASLFTPRAIFYRFEKGLQNTKISVAVVVQKMVNSEKAGIAFSVHPVTQDRSKLIIEAAYGLGEAVVSGAVTPNSYVVQKNPMVVLEESIINQGKALYRGTKKGNEWKKVSEEEGNKSVLNKEQTRALSEIILGIENHYSFPCDIEWAYEDNKFYIVQSRPITTMNDTPSVVEDIDKNLPEEFREVNKLEDWFLIEEIPGSGPILLAGVFRRMTEWFNNEFNIPIKMNLLYKNNTLFLYFLHKQLNVSSNVFLNKSLTDINFLKDIDKRNKGVQAEMFKYSDKLIKIDYSKLSDEQIISEYENYVLLWEKAVVAGWVDNVLEFENESFSGYLRKYITEKIDSNKLKNNPAEVFSIFSTPSKETKGAGQERALQEISKKIRFNIKTLDLFLKKTPEKIINELKVVDEKIDALLDKHTRAYCWYFYMYEGPGWGKIDFITSIKKILEEAPEELGKVEDISKTKKRLINELNIDKKHQILLDIASEIVFNKDLRKHSIYYACYSSKGLFEEIAKRLNLSVRETRIVLPWEMRQLYITNKYGYNINERESGLLMKFYKGKAEILGIQEAEGFYNRARGDEKISDDISEIKGSCAYPGFVKGIAKIVNSTDDMDKIKLGDILVSHQTDPDILPAMKLASAFVTDLGGITCHAAIVSREMKKPCIVGTKIGSKVISDGDLLEVDANKGILRILKKKNSK